MKRWILIGAGILTLFVTSALLWAIVLSNVQLTREQRALRTQIQLDQQLIHIDVQSETQALRAELVRTLDGCSSKRGLPQ